MLAIRYGGTVEQTTCTFSRANDLDKLRSHCMGRRSIITLDVVKALTDRIQIQISNGSDSVSLHYNRLMFQIFCVFGKRRWLCVK